MGEETKVVPDGENAWGVDWLRRIPLLSSDCAVDGSCVGDMGCLRVSSARGECIDNDPWVEDGPWAEERPCVRDDPG